MGAPRGSVEAIEWALGCEPYRGPGEDDICVKAGHDEPWTVRGCPAAVAAADAAYPSIAAHALADAAGDVREIPRGYPNNPRIRSLQAIANWLNARADQIEARL